MAEPMMMNGATDSPLSLLSPEAREGMMRPSEERLLCRMVSRWVL